MSFPSTIALTATEHASTVPVVDPSAASGIFSLAWLVIALPLAGGSVVAGKQFGSADTPETASTEEST